jgi:GTPase
VMKASGFDYILVETVGVGQSEIEIAELADVTVVVFVPESGDEVQAIKSGIVEIADIFVVNKSDRDGSDRLVKTLAEMVHERGNKNTNVPVLKTVSTTGEGVSELVSYINDLLKLNHQVNIDLLYQRTLRLAGSHLLKKYDLSDLKNQLELSAADKNFNMHNFLTEYFTKK